MKIPRRRDKLPTPVFLGFRGVPDGKESACDVGDLGSIPGKASGFFTTEPLGNAGGVSLIPGPGRSLGGGHGNPLQ